MNAVEAARAYVKTYFDNNALTKGINSAKRQLTDLGGSMMGVGTKALAAAAPVLGFGAYAVHAFEGAASALSDMSQVTGIGVESLSELSYASGQLGSDIDSLGGAMKKQSKFMGDVASGSKEAQGTLDRLGLSASDLKGMTGDQQLGVFADAIAGITDQTAKANAAMDVFGGTGTDLLPMLNAGSAGIDAMRKQARDLGVVMSAEAAASGDEFGDAMTGLKAQLGALTNGVGAALVPALTDLIATVTPMIASTNQWVQENGELILTFASIAAGVATAGAALVTLGAVISGLGIVLGGVVTAGTAIVAVLGAILSPVGLVVAGIVGLIAYTTDWSSAWSSLSDSMGESLGQAVSLIQNGELQLAMELVWAQIQVTWSQGVKWVVGQVGEMVTATLKVLAGAIDTLGTMLDKTRNSLARGIAGVGEFTGVLPEGTSDELLGMQAAGQAGTSALHGMSESLVQAADGFSSLGDNVSELQAKLDKLNKLKGLASTAIEAGKVEMFDWDKEYAAEQARQKAKGGPQPVLNTGGGALAGTFSSQASRQLFSGSGNVVESELKAINSNTKKMASSNERKLRIGS